MRHMRADKFHTLKFLYSRQYRVTHADDSDDFAYQIAQREFQAKKPYRGFASVRNGFSRPRSTHNGRLPQK